MGEKSLKTWLTPLSTIRRVLRNEYMKSALHFSGAFTASSLKTKAWGLHDASLCHGDSGLWSKSCRLSDSSNCAPALSSSCQSSEPLNVGLRYKSKDCTLFSELYLWGAKCHRHPICICIIIYFHSNHARDLDYHLDHQLGLS